MIYAPERIETARLVLRRPTLEDAEAIFARYASDAEVARYLAWPLHRSVKDTLQFLRESDSDWKRGPAGPYLIDHLETGGTIGATGFSRPSNGISLTGYVLARDAWGRGYATEALQAMVNLAADFGVIELRALCHPENAASIRVLEKCGFRRAGATQALFPNIDPEARLDCLRFVLLPGAF